MRDTIANFSLFEVGVGLMNGLISGVKSKVGDMIDSVYGAIESAIDAAKNLLGIESPSKVFAEIGRQVMEGLILGIDAEQAKAAQTVADAVAAICEAAVKAADALRNFRPVNNLGVITAQVMEFLLGVEREFESIIKQVNQELADKGKAFADAVGPVVDLIVKGLEVLAALPKYVTRLKWQEVNASLEYVAWAVQVMARMVAKWAATLEEDIADAARDFAESTGGVVDVIGKGLELLSNLPARVTRLSWQEVVASLEYVAWVVQVMVREVAQWGSTVAGDLQAAAKAFADNAGPVIGIITDGLDAIAALRDFEGLTLATFTQVENNMADLAHFLAHMVTWMEYGSRTISGDLMAAAKTFAENAGPVIDIITDGLEAIATLRSFESLTLATFTKIENNMVDLATFLAKLMEYMSYASGLVQVGLQFAAAKFATNVKTVLESLNTAFATLKSIAELEAPAVGLAWVTALETAMSAAVPSLETALAAVVSAFETALTNLQAGSYAAGYGFMTSLADGLTAGLTYVEAALTALAELFPHSPAKAGPLRVAPDWSAWMLGGLGDATNMVSSGLGWTMPRGLIPGTLGGGGSTSNSNTTININNPVVRDEMDIQLLTQAISEALAGTEHDAAPARRDVVGVDNGNDAPGAIAAG